MLEIFLLSLQLLAAPASTPAVGPTCHWLTADLGRFEIGKKARRRACRWEPTVRRAAKRFDLDPDLLGALIVVESRWRPWAVSHAHACGLTQVIPKWTGGTASGRRKWTCEQLKRPHTAIGVGARILRWWITHRKGDVREGLCGYNAGFRTCKRAGARYARKVLGLQVRLKAARIGPVPPKRTPKAPAVPVQGNN
jgi:soluble lytic murein transglycosylase-like protein